MNDILPKIISYEQDGFVKDRQIVDGIITRYEILHSIDKRKEVGMLLKLDMQKAFDRVSWSFLDKLLVKFGFYET